MLQHKFSARNTPNAEIKHRRNAFCRARTVCAGDELSSHLAAERKPDLHCLSQSEVEQERSAKHSIWIAKQIIKSGRMTLSPNQIARTPQSADRETAYRDALARLFSDCARDLRVPGRESLPDAQAMRQLQEQMRRFVTTAGAPPDVQFAVFLLDIVIADVFKNFFGDLISTQETDEARQTVCSQVADLLEELSRGIVNADDSRQMTALRNFAVKSLIVARGLNDWWTDQRLRRAEPNDGRKHYNL